MGATNDSDVNVSTSTGSDDKSQNGSDVVDKSDVSVQRPEDFSEEKEVRGVFSGARFAHSQTSPEAKAGWFSHLTFSWVNEIFRISAQKRKQGEELETSDIWKGLDKDDTNTLVGIWNVTWSKRFGDARKQKCSDGSIWPNFTKKESFWLFANTMREIFSKMLLEGFLLRLLTVAMYFAIPFLMNGLLQYVAQRDTKEVTEGVLYVLGLVLAMILRVAVENAYYQNSVRMGWQTHSMLMSAIFQKALKLSSSSRQTKTVGEMVNILQLDTQSLQFWCEAIHPVWSAPVQLIGYVIILYFFIGWAAFAGLGLLVFVVPLTNLLFRFINRYTGKRIEQTDLRVKITNECLQGSLGVKMAAWEDNFATKINQLRSKEVSIYRKMHIFKSFGFSLVNATPAFTSVAAIVTYAFAGNELDAPTIFTAIATFQQLAHPLGFLVFALTQTARAMVSLQRIGDYMIMEEVESKIDDKHASGDGSVVITDGEFSWAEEKPESEEQPEKTASKTKKNKSSKMLGKSKTKAEKKDSMDDESDEGTSRSPTSSVLTNINLVVKPKSLTAVIGPVGTGKSSLCGAIIGELHKKKGTVQVNGSIAYAAQSPWILNATVRDNILFGEKFDSDRYWQVIKVCQLSHDLDVLEAGDMTMIGEKGINLSGGQKQRVSIARAAYSSKQIILLDDPLSALDPGVASKLFNQCIRKFMGDKTRILITNQLNFLSSCDWIAALATHDKTLADITVSDASPVDEVDASKKKHSSDEIFPGYIAEQGTFSDLMSGDASFASLVHKFRDQQKQQEQQRESSVIALQEGERDGTTTADGAAKQSKKDSDNKLMQIEERSRGSVKLKEYKGYIKAGGGYCTFAVLLLILAIQNAVMVLSSAWVGLWSRAEERNYVAINGSEVFFTGVANESLELYAYGYVISGFILMFFAYCSSVGFIFFALQASQTLHSKLLVSVLAAPMSFFDTTPLGRIIARFATDVTQLDTRLGETLLQFCSQFMQVFGTLITISVATPLFMAFILPLAIIYRYVLQIFRPVTRELQRITSIARSPIYAHFSETVGGLSTIRSYNKVSLFTEQNIYRVNEYIEAFTIQRSADRWLAIRLEMIGIMVIAAAAGLAAGGTVDAAIAGLSLTYATAITSLLNYGVRSFAYLENGMNSYERVNYYSTEIEQEKPRTSNQTPDKSWPSKGEIVLNNLRMRYRPTTPLVLKGLSLTINGGERVGVVGRTGSGKSSLMLCLLRLVEPVDAETSSPIVIDGVDICKIGLHELRKKISIVPQNPTIFSGTVRSNLDPFDEYSDVAIWEALEKVDLKSLVSQSPGKLEFTMAEFGENFSQGQRQLLCLARTLLNKAQILMLDEATSSVDFETDMLIQNTIRSKTSFDGCTILTIAHRINTVIDNDKILVLDYGNVAEYDSPANLLADSSSMFSQMAKARKEQE